MKSVLKEKFEQIQQMNWKKLFNPAYAGVIGLDIGSSSVRLVQLEKRPEGYAVVAAGISHIEGGGIDDETKKTEEKTLKAILNCLKECDITTKFTVCGLCGSQVAVRHFKFPKLPEAELDGAVTLEAAQVCPFSVDDGVVDYQLLNSDHCSEGVLVAATNKVVFLKKKLIEKAELECVLVEADALSLLNCLEQTVIVRPKTFAVLNVGSSYTNLAINNQNNVPFVRDIMFAGNNIIKKVATENNISIRKAVKAIHEYHTTEDQNTIDSFEKACFELITDIRETLRYYSAQTKSNVEKIYVCGGFALVEGFLTILQENLKPEIVLWNPFENMEFEIGAKQQENIFTRGPAMAVAAGLAMRSI